MKLHYYPETDSLYIELKSTSGTKAREIVDGLVVDFDAKGDVVGLDIDHVFSTPSPGATPDTSGLAPPSPTRGEGLKSAAVRNSPLPLWERASRRDPPDQVRGSHGGKGEG